MYLGLDLGTSALKALICDEKLNVIAEASANYNVIYVDNNGTEQDPNDWISALDKVLTELKPYLKDIKAMSISGQMHGLVILDKDDKVIRPCILWNDGRTILENNDLNSNKRYIYQETSNISYAGFTLPKILWLRNNEIDNFNKIAKVMLPKDYILYYLTGNFVSDYTDMAGSLLLDVKKRCYNDNMVSLSGLNYEQLPKLLESYNLAGYLKDELTLKYGFNKPKVVVGGADNALASLGTGTIKEGVANISLGTSGTLLIPVKKVPKLDTYGLHIFSHVKDSYIMACILSAANCRKWWLEDIIKTDDYLNDELNMADVNTNDLYFLPYLNGERSPHNDPLAKGAFIGLTSNTTRAMMSKAILEGVGFALRENYELVKDKVNIKYLTICGGGTKSKLWCQLISDIFNLEVKTIVNEQGPALGAILLSMIGDNKLNYEDIPNLIQYGITYTPKNSEYYNEKYNKYIRIYPTIKNLYQ